MVNAVTLGFFREIEAQNIDFSKLAEDPSPALERVLRGLRGKIRGTGTYHGGFGGGLGDLLKKDGFFGKMSPERVGKFYGIDPEDANALLTYGVSNAPNEQMRGLMRHDNQQRVRSRSRRKEVAKGLFGNIMDKLKGVTKKTTTPIGGLAGAGYAGLTQGFGEGMGTQIPAGTREPGFLEKNRGMLGIGAGLIGAHLLSKYLDNRKSSGAWPPASPAPKIPSSTDDNGTY